MPTIRRRPPVPIPPAVMETAAKVVAMMAIAVMTAMLPLAAAHAMTG